MATFIWPPTPGSGGLVSSVNGLTGAITLAAGTNISITPSGNTLTFAFSGNLPVTNLNSGSGASNTTFWRGDGVWGTPAGGGGGGITTIGNIDSQSPSANGAVIVSTTDLVLQSADISFPGLVNNTTQSFSGNKTFTGTIAASNYSGTSSGTNTGDVTLGTASGLSLVGQVLSLQLADTSNTGALSNTDWNTFNGKGSTSSVALSVPAASLFGVTGSPVTTTGTLGLTTSGTSGGIPYFSSISQLNSSALLTVNALILGGGGGAAPASLSSLGTTTTVLHGNASGAPTFGAVDLANDVTGNLGVSRLNSGTAAGATTFWRGDATWSAAVTSVALSVPATSIFGVSGSPVTTSGTLGLTTTGTSGGIPYFSSSSQLASSGALTQHAIVLGGGSAATPTVVGSLGTSTQVLHGAASGDPTWGAVSLTADVSGILPMSAGGTNKNMTASAGAIVYSDADSQELTAVGTAGQVLTSQAAGTPTFEWGARPQIFGSRASPRAIVAATGITSGASHMSTTALAQDIYVEGSITGDSIAATITAGTIDGQIMRIKGRNDTKTVSLDDTTTNVVVNGYRSLAANSVIVLSWDTTNWQEISFTE